MSRIARPGVTLALVVGVGCNALTGVDELERVECVRDCPDDAAIDAARDSATDSARDAATDAATDAGPGDAPTDASDVLADGPDGGDAGDAAARCTNKVLEPPETDVDCGGGVCPACATGKKCGGNADCASKICAGGLCAAPRCDDGAQNGDETGIDCGGATCAPCGTLVWTASGADASISTPKLMGTLKAYAGKRIRIVKVGICGDSDATSGPNRFVAADGAALSFSWAAGQTSVALPGTTTYRLTPTPVVAGTTRGFSYQVVSHLAGVGAAVTVSWDFHADYDGLSCGAADEDGTAFTDAASTVRAWVKYRYE